MKLIDNCASTGGKVSQSISRYVFPRDLLGRLYLLAVVYALEAVLVTGALHIQSAFHPGLIPVAIVSLAVFMGLAYPWLKSQKEDLRFGFIFFGCYLSCVAGEIVIHVLAAAHQDDLRFLRAAAISVSAIFLLKVPFLALACLPLNIWRRMFRATHLLWIYAVIAGLAAWFLVDPSQSLWNKGDAGSTHIMQTATFDAVRFVIRGVMPDVSADAATFTIENSRYSMEIAFSCSGMEGLGLVFAFTSIWLWYSRKECRFPQALLLIPLGLGCIWLLNIFRLSALFFIGNFASDEVADIGFHTQFGWIAFTAVALAFSMATEKLAWVRKQPLSVPPASSDSLDGEGVIADGSLEQTSEHGGESQAIRAYLIPFLAILAATFLTKAISGYFDRYYFLRFIVAAIALYYFRSELKKLNWRFGWLAPVAGAAVFLMWIAPSWWAHQPAASRLGSDLAALSPAARWAWLAFRVAAAVITVPIAEELAFRGYLARRLMSRDFDQISFSSLTVLAICLSSVVFGVEHMKNMLDWQHLLLGTVAGLAFAAVLRWRGRFGDAVVAHAVSNLLLAAWVLGTGDWTQW